jgi:hypothetical protein
MDQVVAYNAADTSDLLVQPQMESHQTQVPVDSDTPTYQILARDHEEPCISAECRRRAPSVEKSWWTSCTVSDARLLSARSGRWNSTVQHLVSRYLASDAEFVSNIYSVKFIGCRNHLCWQENSLGLMWLKLSPHTLVSLAASADC